MCTRDLREPKLSKSPYVVLQEVVCTVRHKPQEGMGGRKRWATFSKELAQKA
jgi:hypothetical protein